MTQKHYKAFISYSHEDEVFGSWLHKELEKYKIPKKLREDYPNLPKTLYPIFRDRYELNAGDDLGVEIPKALENSDALIVVCSTKSADSKWVNKEIIDFKMMHGEDKIFPIILDGEPFARESDKFDDELECFPEALKYKIDSKGNLTNEQTSILASSAIEKEDGRELAKLKLIAGVLGVPFGEFHRRDEEQKKKDKIKLISIWSFVSLMIIGFAVFGWVQRDIAIKQEERTKKSLYKNIMNQGFTYRDILNKPLFAKLFFANAVKISSSNKEEIDAIISYNSVQNIKLKNIYVEKNSIKNLVLSKDKKNVLIYFDNSDFFKVLNLITNKKLLYKHIGIQGAKFLDNQRIISWDKNNTSRIWNLNGKEEQLLKSDDNINDIVIYNKKQKILCVGNHYINIFDIKDNKKIMTLKHNEENNPKISGILFNKNETKLIVWSDHLLSIWDKFGKRLLTLNVDSNSSNIIDIRGVKFNQDETKIITWGHYGVMLWDSITGKKLQTFKHISCQGVILFDNDISKIATYGNDKKINFWHINKDKKIYSFYAGQWIYNILVKNSNTVFKFAKNNMYLLYVIGSNKISLYKYDFETNQILCDLSFKPLQYEMGDIYSSYLSKLQNIIISGGNGINIGNTLIVNAKSGGKIVNLISNFSIIKNELFDKSMKILTWGENLYGDKNFNKGELKIWEKMPNIKQYKLNKPINYIFSKTYKYLLHIKRPWLTSDITISKINFKSNKIVYKKKYLSNHYVENIFFNKNETKLIGWNKSSIIRGNYVFIINMNTHKEDFFFRYKHYLYGVLLSKDEKNIISWDEKAVYIHNILTKKLIKTIKYNAHSLNVTITNTGNLLIRADNFVDLRDSANGSLLKQLTFNNQLYGSVLTGDEQQLLTWGRNQLLLTNIKSNHSTYLTNHQNAIINAMFDKKEQYIVSWDNISIKIWDRKLQKVQKVFKHSDVRKIIFNKNSTKLLSIGEHNIKLWDMETGKQLVSFKFDTILKNVKFNDDETKILVLTYGKNIFDKMNLYECTLIKSDKINKKYYPLKAQVETGAYLTASGEVKALTRKEWLQKKKQYELKLEFGRLFPPIFNKIYN